ATNRRVASHTASADALVLKNARPAVRFPGPTRSDPTRPSQAAVSAPAAGPYRTAEATTNASPGDALITNPGIRIADQAGAIVSATRAPQAVSGGCRVTAAADASRTAVPAVMMAAR